MIKLKSEDFEALDHLYLSFEGYKKGSDVPIMISVRPQGHSCSLQFSAKIVGQEVEDDEEESNYIRVGEPLTLTRS